MEIEVVAMTEPEELVARRPDVMFVIAKLVVVALVNTLFVANRLVLVAFVEVENALDTPCTKVEDAELNTMPEVVAETVICGCVQAS